LKRTELTLEESFQHFLTDSIRSANDPEGFVAVFDRSDECVSEQPNETMDNDVPISLPRLRSLHDEYSSVHFPKEPLLNDVVVCNHTAGVEGNLEAFSDLSDHASAPFSDEPVQSNNSPTSEEVKQGYQNEQITQLLLLPILRSSHPASRRFGRSKNYSAMRPITERAPP
jgi:hypothetical protein